MAEGISYGEREPRVTLPEISPEEELKELNEELALQIGWSLGIIPSLNDLMEDCAESQRIADLTRTAELANLIALRAEMAVARRRLSEGTMTTRELIQTVRMMKTHISSEADGSVGAVQDALDTVLSQCERLK